MRAGLNLDRPQVGEDDDAPRRFRQIARQREIRLAAGKWCDILTQMFGQADDDARVGSVEGDVQTLPADRLTAELLAAEPDQRLARQSL